MGHCRVIWLTLVCCGDPAVPPPAVPPPPETPEAHKAPTAPPVAPRRAKSGPFAWEDVDPIGLEVRTTQDVRVQLMAKPTASVESGRCMWAPQVTIPVTASVRLVRRPVALPGVARELVARETVEYPPTRLLPLTPPAASPGDLTLAAKSTVDWVGTRDDGRCMYRIDERLVATTCFADAPGPPVAERWLEVACEVASGWLRVDEREDVEVAVAGAP